MDFNLVYFVKNITSHLPLLFLTSASMLIDNKNIPLILLTF